MLRKLRTLIYFLLVFLFTFLQVQILSFHEIHAQNKQLPITKEVEIDHSNEDIKVTNETSPIIYSITVDKSNVEVIGTVFRFTAVSEGKNLNYEWTIFKDFDEVYKKEYSEENFLDFTMNKLGRYQAVVRIKDENGITISKLSEEINIIRPIKIHSVWVDKNGKQLVNTPLTFSVSAEGDDLVYHWYIFRDSNIVYDGLLSPNNSIHYTPNEPGVYKAIVYVKDKFEKCISAYSEEIIIYENVLSEKEKLEAIINAKDFSSKTNHYIWIDTDKNLTYVFEGSNKNWHLIKTMLCTDGKASTPTVKGNFIIDGRAPWLTSYNGKLKAKYKVRFFGNYYFHSILFDSTGKNIVDSRLGQSLSHGCVRLSVEDAKWIYDNIQDGTGVYIS
ncbi:L,D-transpeptidase family protein [Crassaminicella thermophila]|uniref:L,D-transpeptidase family protein n=1 Tax=Crassaminicella thermophila TaxID=2599308 RepID=A0A5C0SDG0_CRATE|nr:L,D-transpeptidase [Crassaminicella thermophila]QEK11274.1 L,D-transpeptidase family protein [Crassaminicella thermophila]